MFWTRKSETAHERARVVGFDLTATRARAVSLAVGRSRTLRLDDATDELPLAVSLERRPTIGSDGVTRIRRLPHLVCSNYLSELGHSRTWQAGRVSLTAEAAVSLAFERLREPIVAESDALALAVPTYLSTNQIRTLAELAAKARLPVRGTVAAPLAVVAHRAAWVLEVPPLQVAETETDARPDWIVPANAPDTPESVVVADLDDNQLTLALVAVTPMAVRLVTQVALSRASLRAWKDRLLDAMADRCVRLCRRDPRDSAEAEQGLYEQLDEMLDRVRLGQSARLSIRSAHWYQDLVHQPDEFDTFCAPLTRYVADSLREMLRSANLPVPPRAVWLTHTAAQMPGLAAALHQSTPEATEVLALPPNAVADAAAVLVPYWLTGMLPRLHLDAVVPLVSGTGPMTPGPAALGLGASSRSAPRSTLGLT